MNNCECYNSYEKLNEDENIEVGDIIALETNENKVTLAFRSKRKQESSVIIGICTKIENNTIYVANKGIYDINVCGLVCLGDKLTASRIPGKAIAIKYGQDETQFGISGLGKVIELYNTYDKVKILLDVE